MCFEEQTLKLPTNVVQFHKLAIKKIYTKSTRLFLIALQDIAVVIVCVHPQALMDSSVVWSRSCVWGVHKQWNGLLQSMKIYSMGT